MSSGLFCLVTAQLLVADPLVLWDFIAETTKSGAMQIQFKEEKVLSWQFGAGCVHGLVAGCAGGAF